MNLISLILLFTWRNRVNQNVEEVVAEDNDVTVCVKSLLKSPMLITCKHVEKSAKGAFLNPNNF